MKFAIDCENKKMKLSLFISSDGQAGADEPMSGIPFDSGVHVSAARLGPRVTERAIKLELMKIRAEAYINEAAGFVDEEDLDESILSFLALLSLKARYLSDLAAERVGIAMRNPQEDLERLLKEAMKHMDKIDSGDEHSWH